MLFHQIQLMVCAALARRYAARGALKTATTHSHTATDRHVANIPEFAGIEAARKPKQRRVTA
jgi:hypothetical protein